MVRKLTELCLSLALVLLLFSPAAVAQSATASASASASATATASATAASASASATATATATASASASSTADATVESIIRSTWPDHEEETAIAVAECESGLDPDAYNPASAAFGLFQFLPSTVAGIGGVYGALDDPVYASLIAAELQDMMGWGPWACAY